MKKDSIDEDKFERLLQLSGKTIILGITGGIAAYKSCDLASRLRQLGANVHVVMTPNAKEFITPLTLKTITRNPVHCEQFQDDRMASGAYRIGCARRFDLNCPGNGQ